MIQQLSNTLINQIAAGEVVDRPFSIVKELIENAIDANAQDIMVFIEDTTSYNITVIDNGTGISKEDLPLVFQNHSTSKISCIADLENILTLGFRGEAMASISSISKVKLITSDGLNGYDYDNGKIKNIASNKGTTIIVEDIFYNVPARKKFLKSPSTEFRYIIDLITKCALANPTIGFDLRHNSKRILVLQNNQKLLNRINDLLKIIDLIEVFYDGKIKISGYIVDPKISFPKSMNQYIIVNGRIISSQLINKAVSNGYGTTLMKGQYPGFVINIIVNPNDIDVNVHPRKTEVRFKDDSQIYQSVYFCVKDALERYQKSIVSQIGSNFNYVDNLTPQKPIHDTNLKATPFDFALAFSKEMIPQRSKDTSNYELPLMPSPDKSTDTSLNIDFDDTINYMQVRNAFIVTSNIDGIQIIDQHAASEKFLFEKYLKQLSNREIEKQLLMIPIDLELPIQDIEIVKNNLELFDDLGFVIEMFGNIEYKIQSLPMMIKMDQVIEIINEIIEQIKNTTKPSLENINKKVAASIACHSAVRFGDKLEVSEMRRIIADLKLCDNPYTCPHGRPTLHTLKFNELEKIFKRVL